MCNRILMVPAIFEFQEFSTDAASIGSPVHAESDARPNEPGERSVREIPRSAEGRGNGTARAEAGER